MRTLKFKIKKLGAIRNSEIELKELIVLSGESGLGKSYVAFLIHYLYVLLLEGRINSFFPEDKDFYESFFKKDTGRTSYSINIQELTDWINKDAVDYIGYALGHNEFDAEVSIELPIEEEFFDFIFTNELEGLNDTEEIFYKITLNGFNYRIVAESYNPGVEPFSILVRAVLIDAIFGNYRSIKRTYLMPPSRGALMELNDKPTFSSGMYDEFFKLKDDLKRAVKTPAEIKDNIRKKLESINVGNLQQVQERLMYYTDKGDSMPLTAAASSIKELAALTLLLNKYSTDGLSIFFEEPEAHLHPDRQVKMADLIACLINNGTHMQITTHSDFLIKRLNVLMALHEIKKEHPSEYENLKLETRWNIDDDCLIKPEKVGAYLLVRDNDGYSTIEKQDIRDGIPFDSFNNVIDSDIDLSMAIRELMREF